jgi:hypothetical protein
LHYATWVKAEEQGAKEFDYELIGRAFYNDLPENRRQWALRQLRPHPHKPASDSNPDFNATLPKLPMDYVGFKNDRAFKPSDQERTAWILGIEYHSIRSGHFAMLSQEKKLASLLINLASRQEAVQDAKIN